MKVLYIAPLLPALSGNGGKRAIYNHLEELQRDKADVDAIFVDVEDSGAAIPSEFRAMHCTIFRRAIPSASSSFKGKVSALWQLVSSALPRSVAVVASRTARTAVCARLAEQVYDMVVVDHLNAFGMLPDTESPLPLLYVAHNVESAVLYQQASSMPRTTPKHWFARIDAAKMRRLENKLLRKAQAVAVIGAGDLSSPLLRPYKDKVTLWPELPGTKAATWTFSNRKQMLFVGSAQYFPNRDAIDWLVNVLMPAIMAIDPAVTLRIAGTRGAELNIPELSARGTFEGFVSTDRLDELHLQADLLICPVELGAGIKIKVLEAASYGLPVAATPTSLKGIDFLQGSALTFDRAAPNAAAKAIVKLLGDRQELERMSCFGLERLAVAHAARPHLLGMLR